MKKIHRFLQLETQLTPTILTEKRLVFQIARVLKLKPDEQISLFYDGKEERIMTITGIEKDTITLKETEICVQTTKPKRNIIAALAITKNDHFELAVQKLSELGISSIIPIVTERTIKTNIKLERLQTISDEAVELSGGIDRVIIFEPLQLSAALEKFGAMQWIVAEKETTDNPSHLSYTEAVLAIGPEGGWSEKELSLFKEKNAMSFSLADRTLRAETAAILAAYTLLWK